jgi:hypothetical protein
MDEHGTAEIADFSFSIEPKKFTVNGDLFLCAPELPLPLMEKAASMRLDRETMQREGMEPILKFFDEVFIGDSAQRFRARVNDRERPIGLRHITKILPWLMESYGLRPTEPSESSSPLPESDGTTSTDGVSQEVSILSNSGSPAS